MPPFVAYHGASAATHQARVDELAPQGYRPISLSVSGDPADARYAAVWVQRPGPGWWAVHGLSAGEYQQRFDELVGQGYAPVLVSVTGPADQATFAALFEMGVDVPWFARHGLRWDPVEDVDTITHENQRAFDQGYIPRCLAVYGTPDDRRFAGVWMRNDGPVPWGWWWTDPVTYQRFFDGLVAAGARPAHVSVAPDGWLLSVFRDQPIGEWWARHGLSAGDYQAEFDARVANGLMPIMVQAGGTGGGARYASVFARDDAPLSRRWTATGASGTGVDDLDDTMRTFMTVHAMRAGAVAIAKDNRVLVARGYTWAESGFPVTQPNTTFRIASLSKIFAAAAVDRLVATGRISWDTRAFPFLGITSTLLTDQVADPATADITVRQLVVRMSGLQRDFGRDLRGVAGRLGITTTPSRDQLVHYIYGEPLAARPGSTDLYSNSAFTVLTSVIERAAGSRLVDFLAGEVTGPMGIGDLHVARTAVGGGLAGEVPFYDNPGVALSQLQPATDVMAPNAYGGTFVLENGEGAGGLVTSAPSVAGFIGSHAVWDVGGRQVATRYGRLEGSCGGAVSRDDGLDFAYLFNRLVTDAELDGITAALHDVLNRNRPFE